MKALNSFRARARQLPVILAAGLFLAGCGLTKRITHFRSVQVDTVRHSVPLPGHALDADFRLADSLTFEDERLKITLWRLAGDLLPADMDTARGRLQVPGEVAAPADSLPGIWRLRAEVKPETVRVAVPQKTVTEYKETTKFVKQTPDRVKYLIGGLVAVLLVLVVAWRIRT